MVKVSEKTLGEIKREKVNEELSSLSSSINKLIEVIRNNNNNNTEELIDKFIKGIGSLQTKNDDNIKNILSALSAFKPKENTDIAELKKSIDILSSSITKRPTSFSFEIKRNDGLIDKVIVKPNSN